MGTEGVAGPDTVAVRGAGIHFPPVRSDRLGDQGRFQLVDGDGERNTQPGLGARQWADSCPTGGRYGPDRGGKWHYSGKWSAREKDHIVWRWDST